MTISTRLQQSTTINNTPPPSAITTTQISSPALTLSKCFIISAELSLTRAKLYEGVEHSPRPETLDGTELIDDGYAHAL